MLVLISFVLVLVATGLLVVGLLQDGLALIYISIACSIAAGVILGVAVKVARPKAATAAGPAPLEGGVPSPAVASEVAPAVRAPSAAEARAPLATQTSAPVSVEPVTAAIPALVIEDDRYDDVEEDLDDEEELVASDEDDEGFFPIADYDDLRANEIVPLLPELYLDELDVVEARERATKSRKAILGRIDQLRVTAPTGDEVVAANGVALEAAPEVIEEEWAAADDAWEADDLGDDDEGFFPIADYDELRVAEILPLLSQLTEDELVEVREHEVAGANRKTILDNIDRRSGRTAPAPARRPASKSAAPARAVPAKRAAAATKKAAQAKASTKATPKKAPAKRPPAKRPPARRR